MRGKATGLYRIFDKQGRLLYVGISFSVAKRLSEHNKEKNWSQDIDTVRVEWFENREAALKAENKAIHEENPKYNVVGVATTNCFIPRPREDDEKKTALVAIERPRGVVFRDESWLAGLLELSPRTIQGWRMRGVGPPFVKFGPGRRSKVRYVEDQVYEWLEQQRRTSTFDQTLNYL